jgi:hypothetical protein
VHWLFVVAGRQGYEAYDIDTRSIGLFQSQQQAADAVARAAGAAS